MLIYQDRKEFTRKMPTGGIVAEIGVQRGDYSSVILELSQPKTLYLIDCWEVQPGEYEADPANRVNHQLFYEGILKKYADRPDVTVMKMYSEVASQKFTDEYFDWVYIDANHGLEAVRSDLRLWWPKVKVNGFLCGHDYITADWPRTGLCDFIHVKEGVDEFCAIHQVSLQALTKDKFASWCIQKPS